MKRKPQGAKTVALLLGATAELGTRIADQMRAGHTMKYAANLCGVHRTTLDHWLNRDDPTKGELALRAEIAKVLGEIAQENDSLKKLARERITAAIVEEEDTKVAQWLLERLDPDFSPKQSAALHVSTEDKAALPDRAAMIAELKSLAEENEGEPK